MTEPARPARLAALTLVAALVAAGCSAPAAPPGRVAVVATIYPLAEFTRRIGGDRVSVQTLVAPGVEAHDFEPTPKEVARLTRARLFVYNGGGFEPWVERLLAQLPETTFRVNTTEGLPLVTAGGGVDPHVWLDPVLAQRQAERILAALGRADREGRPTLEANTAALGVDLQGLDADFRKVLAGCRRKEFLTAHAAFGYLARRYGLRATAISGLAPEVEPSASRVKAIVQQARRAGIRVIYVEPRGERRVAEAIAREIGGTIAVLDPLESLAVDAQRAGKNYFTVMHENLDRLSQGLDCG